MKARTVENVSFKLGIDLGTTYSCVGVWRNNRVEIIANDQGNRITPSYVTFTGKDKLVGDIAKEQAAYYYKSAIYDSKRLIGRSISDKEIQEDKKVWPFEVQEADGNLVYKVRINDKMELISPEEIASYILEYLKKVAEKYLGQVIKNAVITVPAYFNNAQRQSTINAGTLAGLNVLAIINEPTAAALAYGFDNQSSKKKKVLIYDLGGGTFDVSLLDIQSSTFKVLATSGNTHLGGSDFDTRLVNYFKEKFINKTRLCIAYDPQAIGRLRAKSEKAKRALSSQTNVLVNVDSLYKQVDFEEKLSRIELNNLCVDLFEQTLNYLDKVINDSKISRDEVDEIVLIGGSTRMCKIQELLSSYFGGKPLQKNINPDEAVAYGAALFARTLNKTITDPLKSLMLVDVTPLSLGIETVGEVMSFVVPRNSDLPLKITKKFTTVDDYQTSIKFLVYEGEDKHSRSNHLLGKFILKGIPPEPKGYAKVDVTFTLDNNGILNVRAYDLKSKNSIHIDINYKLNSRKAQKLNSIGFKTNTAHVKKGELALVKKN